MRVSYDINELADELTDETREAIIDVMDEKSRVVAFTDEHRVPYRERVVSHVGDPHRVAGCPEKGVRRSRLDEQRVGGVSLHPHRVAPLNAFYRPRASRHEEHEEHGEQGDNHEYQYKSFHIHYVFNWICQSECTASSSLQDRQKRRVISNFASSIIGKVKST